MPIKQLLSIVILVTGFNINSLAANKTLKVPNDYLTIQAAIDKAKNGDTVLVEDGVYFGAGNHNIDFRGKAITVKSEHGSKNTTLLLQSQQGFRFQHHEQKTSVLDGFSLKKGGNYTIYIHKASPTIKDCHIFSSNGTGIQCENGAYPVLENIRIENCSEFGLFVKSGSAVKLANGIVSGNKVGIRLFHSSANTSTIHNTLIINQLESGMGLEVTTTIVNCVVMGNKQGAKITRVNNNNATSILNSIIRGNGAAENDETGNLNNVSDHSIFLYSNIQGIEDGTGNVDVDPKFVDDESGDYRLGSGSPCIDAGSPGPPHKDADGSRNDMGIYGGPHGGKWSNLSQDQTTTSDCNKGDVNADGLIKSIDASLALRLAADLISNPSTEQLCAADINNDGQVKSIDASLILRLAAGLEIPTAAPTPIPLGVPGKLQNPSTQLNLSFELNRDQLRVEAHLQPVKRLLAVDLLWTYDPEELALQQVVLLNDFAQARSLVNQQSDGQIVIPIASDQPITVNQPEMIQLHFQLRKPALTDRSHPVQLTDLSLWSTEGQLIPSRIQLPTQPSPLPPLANRLGQNYPNPFNPETWIPFELSQDGPVRLRIFDANGSPVRQLDLGLKPAGRYLSRNRAVYWDGRSDQGELVASGLYFYQIQSHSFRQTRRMVILK
jgi:hypothetical protein